MRWMEHAHLLDLPLAELSARACRVRDAATGTRVTYSPEGVHPAHHAVPRPLRLLHVRPAPGPPRQGVPRARGGAGHRPGRAPRPAATRPCSRWASGPSCATRPRPAGWPSTVTTRPSTTWPPCAGWCVDETGLLPHANAGALYEDELAALRPVAPSQGMMIESLRRRPRRPPGRAGQRPGAPAGHAGGRGASRHPLHDRDPRRHRRGPGGPADGPGGHRRRPSPPRPRAGGDRPELPAQAGHGYAPGARLPAGRAPRRHRPGPPGPAARGPRAGPAQPRGRLRRAAGRGHRRLGRRVARDRRPRQPRAPVAGAGPPAAPSRRPGASPSPPG